MPVKTNSETLVTNKFCELISAKGTEKTRLLKKLKQKNRTLKKSGSVLVLSAVQSNGSTLLF